MLSELNTEQLAERRAQLPLRPYPMLYFGWAHLCLLTAALTLAVDPRGVAGFFYHSRMLAVVHLVTLGWITSSILGALYLAVPMAFRVPLRRRRLDGWIFWLYVIGGLGMVSHFWIDALSGMIWSAGTAVLGLILAAVRFLPALAQSPVPAAVKLHLWFAFINILLAGLLGMTVGLNKFFPFLPGGPLSGVLAHAHLAILGWATLVVMGVGYRLIPMLLPAAVPRGRGVGASAVLMELGTLTLATALLLESPWALVGAGITAAGVAAFGYHLIWMRRHLRPAPPARRVPDLGVLQVALAIGYLGVAVGIGSTLVVGERGPWMLRAAMAYGVCLLLGFLSQIVVGVSSRIVPWAAYLWGFGDSGFQETPPSPHDLPHRALQWVTIFGWILAVPAIGLGLTFDAIGLLRAGGALLSLGVVAGGLQLIVILRRSRSSWTAKS
jgi:hypothetical protein